MRQRSGTLQHHRSDLGSGGAKQNEQSNSYRLELTRGKGVSGERVQSEPAFDVQDARSRVARFFIDLRAALNATPDQVAAHLLTERSTIEALETGAFEYLPPWPETSRIVMAYAALLHVDGRPVLAAIAEAVRCAAHHATPVTRTAGSAHLTRTHVQPSPRRLPGAAAFRAVATVGNRSQRRAALGLIIPVVVAISTWNTSAMGSVVRPVQRAVTEFSDFFKVYFAPVDEGHRWIDVRDPRSRRSDKLQK